jgi:putative component of toxin-antitoxin plasmid stabilization module
LCGGNKATQRKDIADATRLWQDYTRRRTLRDLIR